MQPEDITTEEWRPIAGWEGLYEVSNHGRVRSLARVDVYMRLGKLTQRPRRERILKPNMPQGYCQVRLTHASSGRNIHRKVHQLVLEAFIGPRPEGHDGCHENNIRSDNQLGNLRWDTKAGNMADKLRHGTTHRQPGESCPTSKLRNDDIYHIRELGGQGMNHTTIAKRFGVSRSNISRILRGVSWSHI